MNVFINANGETLGPLSADELKQQVQERRLSLADLAWTEGMAEWKAIKDVPELVCLVVPVLPPQAQRTAQAPPSIPTQLPPRSQRPSAPNGDQREAPPVPENQADWNGLTIGAAVLGLILAVVLDIVVWKALEPEPMVTIPGIRDDGRNWTSSLLMMAFVTVFTVWGSCALAHLLRLLVRGPASERNKAWLFFAAIFGTAILFAVASASINLQEYMLIILLGGLLGGAIAGSKAAHAVRAASDWSEG